MRELDLSDNAAQVVRLSFIEHAGVPDVVIGNIHVLFNHKRGDIKLGQVASLLSTSHSKHVLCAQTCTMCAECELPVSHAHQDATPCCLGLGGVPWTPA